MIFLETKSNGINFMFQLRKTELTDSKLLLMLYTGIIWKTKFHFCTIGIVYCNSMNVDRRYTLY